MIVAFANQKGGAGKTTGAVHAAYWLNKRGSMLLVDSDHQESSSTWMKALDLPWKTISDPDNLFDELPKLAKQYDAVVVDGPGGKGELNKAILARADLVLVPCQPSGLDLHSTKQILRFIGQFQELRSGAPYACLFFNRAIRNSVLLRESRETLALLQENREAIAQANVHLLESIIYQRQCLADASGQATTAFQMLGRPAKEAAKDYKSLFEEALGVMKS